MAKILFPIYFLMIGIIPFFAAVAPFILFEETWQKLLWIACLPLVFVLSFVLIAGTLSRVVQRGIVPGKFPRDPADKVYGCRKLYGLCWTSVYYFKPLYWVFLTAAPLKTLLFKLFGYKGSCGFTCYPDTWIRDLPLLDIGKSAYLSNRATIGTNICLKDNSILVDQISVGPRALIGHLSLIGPGSKLGEAAEVGVKSAIGIRSTLGNTTKISPDCAINHGVVIGDGCSIGPRSFVGLRAVIKSGIKVPPGTTIPAGAVIETQADVDSLVSAESKHLEDVKNYVARIMVAEVAN